MWHFTPCSARSTKQNVSSTRQAPTLWIYRAKPVRPVEQIGNPPENRRIRRLRRLIDSGEQTCRTIDLYIRMLDITLASVASRNFDAILYVPTGHFPSTRQYSPTLSPRFESFAVRYISTSAQSYIPWFFGSRTIE
jgi:hypothetical protein